MTTTADRLAPGESGYIESLLISGARRSRLLDLGLTPGTHLDIDAKSTAGEVTVSQANSLGAAASIIGASGVQRINYRASSVIRTAETN